MKQNNTKKLNVVVMINENVKASDSTNKRTEKALTTVSK